MQKNAKTIAIAFLAGVVVAGAAGYVVTGLRKPSVAAVSAAAVSAPPSPAAQPAPAPPQADPTPAPPPSKQEESAAPEAAPAPVRHKPSPQVAKAAPRERAANEESAAPQPTRAQVAQNDPAPVPALPPAPVAAAVPPQPASPNRPAQTLNPPPDTQSAPPPPREPRSVTLAAGTPITVRVNETISTETNYAGDTFTASLDRPLIVDGFVIAERGSRVVGKVLRAEKAGRVKGLSNLQLAITEIHTTDGQTVHIETNPWNQEGPSSKKRDGAEIGGGAALGAIIGAIAGGGKGAAIGAGAGGAAGTGAVITQRGKPSVVPAETRITFALNNNVAITEKLN